MARLPIDKKRLSRLSGRTLARYIDFVYRNSRLVIEPASSELFLQQHRPAIIAVWHGQFLLAPKAKPLEMPLAVVLARHGDAEFFVEALSRFNTTLIRGAGAGERRKDRGGAHALRAALRALESNVFVGMTADVPPGPARRAGEGIVTLARMSGRPIIPLASATSRYHALDTWSRMTVNLPFGTLACVFGEPIFVARDADAATLEAARLAVQTGLDETTRRAYALAGADPARATPPTAGNSIPIAPPQRPGIGLRTYAAATRLIEPAAPLLLGRRASQGREDVARRGERLGIASCPRPDGTLMWIHSASVGEINAVLPLSDALRAERPDLRFLFTTGTVTSAGLAARRLGSGDIHQYVPLDSPRFVRRFLAHWRPDMAVFTESEIWPNLVMETAARAIPMALVNARMSNRSFSRWQRLKTVSGPLLSRFAIVLAQNDEFAGRFAALGARHALSVGNIKIDAPPPPVDEAELATLRQAFAGRPLLVAASTHDGEERIIAAAHRDLARRHPGFCTLIAPRHPERGTEIAELMRSAGFTVAQRSLGQLPTAASDIYIADTIGELGTFYALSPVAFIGGSLVERGGQNPIEAVRCGAVVLVGPTWQNFVDAYTTLIGEHGALIVGDAAALATAVDRLLGDEVEMQRMRTGAQAAIAALSGALERSVAELLEFLPDGKELRRAG